MSAPYLVICGLVALGLLLWGLHSLRRKRLIENVPTSKVKGVFLGLNEVKGRARADAPLTSFLAAARCVYYAYEVEESWSKTVTRTNSKGETETETESGWETVASGGEAPPFEIEDDTGRLRVVPEGAEVTATGVFDVTCGRDDALYYAKGPRGAVSHSDHERRFTESAILVGEGVYVMGCARLRSDRVEPEIARDRDAELFLISTKSEEQIVRGYGYATFFPLLLGAAAAFLFPAGFSLDRGFQQAIGHELFRCIAAAGGYLGFIALAYLVFVYNGLADVKRRAQMAWSMIEVQLKRRSDLVPQLVACVKGYARHEEETQRLSAALRVEGPGGGRDGGRRASGRARGRRTLPGPQGVAGLRPAPRRAHGHGGPDRVRARVLQRDRHRAQHPPRDHARRAGRPAHGTPPRRLLRGRGLRARVGTRQAVSGFSKWYSVEFERSWRSRVRPVFR